MPSVSSWKVSVQVLGPESWLGLRKHGPEQEEFRRLFSSDGSLVCQMGASFVQGESDLTVWAVSEALLQAAPFTLLPPPPHYIEGQGAGRGRALC